MSGKEKKPFLSFVTGKKGLLLAGCAACVGVLLLFFPGEAENSGGSTAFTYDSAESYVMSLEERAAALLEEVGGLRSCKVMITLETGYTYLYATNERVDGIGDGTRDSEKEYVLAARGSDEQPLLVRETMPAVRGVAVVCGGLNAERELAAMRLLEALFDVPSNRISITSG